MTVALTQAVVEIERHVSAFGWDQPARLYALVDTAALVRSEPQLAQDLGLAAEEGAPTTLTPIEQDEIPAETPIDEFLAGIAWPDAVLGCAIVVERLMLPPAAEAELPTSGTDEEIAAWVAARPDRQEVRIAVGVMRDGSRESVLRLRDKDEDTEVLSGASLVPGLAEALEATFS
ncbi:PPA1309 family protein [Yinghuangia seranimata]|uniref:PPA1309 family protein n=1 Tax=Yinghuangia seranimata TaxID=408067 RepID=UPI00248C6404|nr:PPA1309 family protein [Yinghuangia seranimata]MDI2128035.1 PPA1309 family protein [Yinghuangia seranimata]